MFPPTHNFFVFFLNSFVCENQHFKYLNLNPHFLFILMCTLQSSYVYDFLNCAACWIMIITQVNRVTGGVIKVAGCIFYQCVHVYINIKYVADQSVHAPRRAVFSMTETGLFKVRQSKQALLQIYQ